MGAHIFGASSSPTVTSFVLRHHAERIKEMFPPQIYEIIKRYFYVDDGTASADTPQAYAQLRKDLEEAMKLGGFSLGKWKCSHPQLVGEEPHTDENSFLEVLSQLGIPM